MKRLLARLWAWANRAFDIVEEDDDVNAYLTWADARLDQLAEEARQAKTDRGRLTRGVRS